MEKQFNGDAIYNPSGKAGEYSYWACNFYVGCSNGCKYCYCKKGVLKKTMGGDNPTLKKCFKDENHALEVFEKELLQNLPELQKHGLFFSFTTDPLLPETAGLTCDAMTLCLRNSIPMKILTKKASWITEWLITILLDWRGKITYPTLIKYVSFGFTLTGHDELEPNASTNAERIEAMRKLHEAGFKTFASIEPIIDINDSYGIFLCTSGFCDLYKIGLERGRKYSKTALALFVKNCNDFLEFRNKQSSFPAKIYFKDGLLKAAGINREDLPSNCVNRDFNLFNI